MSLIALQDAALAAMAEQRTSERREKKHVGSVLRRYRRKAAALGYSPTQVDEQVLDLRDMHRLNEGAES